MLRPAQLLTSLLALAATGGAGPWTSRAQAQALSPPSVTGNCQSGTIPFDASRILHLNGGPMPTDLDVSAYDYVVEYGSAQVAVTPEGKLRLTLSRDPAGGATALGVRISSTRYYLHARMSSNVSVPAVNGMVTAFITMSDRKDEIDFEWTTNKPNDVQTNVFYKGIAEYQVHSRLHQVSNAGGIQAPNEYTIDWRSSAIDWSINGQAVRKHALNSPDSQSPMTPAGERWFPTTASRIQLSVWDAGASPNSGTSQWAGGPINWGSATSYTAVFDPLSIQCYDAQDNPVPAWPVSASNPPPRKVIPGKSGTGNTADPFSPSSPTSEATPLATLYMASLVSLGSLAGLLLLVV